MRNLNPAYCDSLANKKPKMTHASAHILCGLQAGMSANPHRICVSGVVLLKKSKMPVDSTVALIAKLRGLSTSVRRAKAVCYASNCRALSVLSIATYFVGEQYHAAQYACGY
jgi:hypothetical protein